MEAVGLDRFNPFDPEVQQCPHPYYRAMQHAAPVFRVPGANLYLVTRHELIAPILRDTTTFSSSFGFAGTAQQSEVAARMQEIVDSGWPRTSTLLTVDPPQHTAFRSTVAQYFAPRRIAELREPVEAIVARLFSNLPETAFDVVSHLAVPLPVEAIARVLNVPDDHLDDFKRWSDDSVATIGAVVSDERLIESARGVVEFQHYFADQLERRGREPTDDLLSELIAARVDIDGGAARPLEMAEMLSILQQLLTAGNETTTKALTEGILLLAQHPDAWHELRSDPAGCAPKVTEEVLRLSTPTQGMFRVVTRDTTIGGVEVPEGARLVVVFAAANRDESVWGPTPDEFDPTRNNLKDHLAFGKGIHFCLGAPLARLEMQVFFEQLARRFRTLLLPEQELRYHPSFLLRGLVRLDVSMAA